jgi:murein DD-endopeptidase MepM/ murein hydrolase activator NlpD
MVAKRLPVALFVLVACASGSEDSMAWDPDEDTSTSGVAPGSESTGSPPVPTATSSSVDSSSDGDEPESTTDPMPDVPTSSCPRVRITIMPGNVLNIRAAPSSLSAEVGELSNNAIVDALGEATGEVIEGTDLWFEIDTGEVQGFVTAAYAECTFDEPPELEPPQGFHLPLECGTTTTIAQGNDGGFTHQGAAFYAFDFSVGIGTPLVAMADGIVIHTFAETMPGDPCYDGGGPECFEYGNLVVLLHGDGSTSLYNHLEAVWTFDGELVPQGSPVGLSGSTGYSTGPHAHIMRMENCGVAQCQSIPLEFLEAGVPETGDSVTSENCPP